MQLTLFRGAHYCRVSLCNRRNVCLVVIIMHVFVRRSVVNHHYLSLWLLINYIDLVLDYMWTRCWLNKLGLIVLRLRIRVSRKAVNHLRLWTRSQSSSRSYDIIWTCRTVFLLQSALGSFLNNYGLKIIIIWLVDMTLTLLMRHLYVLYLLYYNWVYWRDNLLLESSHTLSYCMCLYSALIAHLILLCSVWWFLLLLLRISVDCIAWNRKHNWACSDYIKVVRSFH